MGYKVEYSMKQPVFCGKTRGKKNRNNIAAKFALLVVIIVLIVAGIMTDSLIPGDASITKTAMNELVADVKAGEQVVDAFAEFCRTVLQIG